MPKSRHPIQFKHRPPPFMWLVETKLQAPTASTALVLEVAYVLEKGAVTLVSPLELRLEFYSHYCPVPKGSGEMRPNTTSQQC